MYLFYCIFILYFIFILCNRDSNKLKIPKLLVKSWSRYLYIQDARYVFKHLSYRVICVVQNTLNFHWWCNEMTQLCVTIISVKFGINLNMYMKLRDIYCKYSTSNHRRCHLHYRWNFAIVTLCNLTYWDFS